MSIIKQYVENKRHPTWPPVARAAQTRISYPRPEGRAHIHRRLTLPPAQVESFSPSREHLTGIMRALFAHISGDRTGWLALLELRLEATRRPELRAALTETLRANLTGNIEGRRTSGFPGDDLTTVLLYYALTALIVEHLTVPGVLSTFDIDELIAGFVDRALPE